MSGFEINWLVVALRVADGWLYGTGFVLALLIWYFVIELLSKHSKKNKGNEVSAKPESTDNVSKPAHYRQGDIECIDAIRAALTPDEFRGYCKGNTLKYVWRERHKGGTESLKKARWYLDRLIAEDEKQGVERLCTKLKACAPQEGACK